MGNESSTDSAATRDSLNGNGSPALDKEKKNGGAHKRRYAPKKRILIEQQQNRRTDSLDSDCGNVSISGTASRAVSRKTSQQRQQQQLQHSNSTINHNNATLSATSGLSVSTQHLLVPDFDSASSLHYYNNNPPSVASNGTSGLGQRKGSCSDALSATGNMGILGGVSSNQLEAPTGNNRRRSRSLCSQQMKNDCQSVQQSQNAQNNNNNGSGSRRSSNGTLPSLTRLRIQQCYKHAKPTIGQQILKRACTLRSEMKAFLAYLNEDRVEELANELHNFITDCVNNIENADNITEISRQFGRMHVQLCNYGFRPEYFSIIADATIAECVRLDGGTHKRCETLLAWSQLMAFMFSGVRDGYYHEIRQQRRSSLPQHRLLLKQNSTNVSIDVDA